MSATQPPSHLSAISTEWSLIHQAHEGPDAGQREARQALLRRYSVAAWKYLRAAVRNEDDASDLFQEFALRFLDGRFAHAASSRGHFRHYLKAALSNLINDHRRRTPRPHPPHDRPDTATPPGDEGALFRAFYREAVLESAFSLLEQRDQREGKPLFHTLRLYNEMQEPSHAELAARLGQLLHREVSPATTRVYLHDARSLFADLVVMEVAHTLDRPARANVEAELGELGLLSYCGQALQRRFTA